MVSGSLFILVSLGSRPHLPSVWSLFFHVCGYLGVLSWLAGCPGLSAVGDVAKSGGLLVLRSLAPSLSCLRQAFLQVAYLL